MLATAGCGSFGDRSDLSGARRDAVMAALAQVGTPYRYGGESPAEGFDCSGLVQFAHREAGVRVPRVAKAQLRAAKRLRWASARPGDLVFFKIQKGQYHVGMMVGEERFVHAPSSGGSIRVERLGSPYWSKRLLRAGTFLN